MTERNIDWLAMARFRLGAAGLDPDAWHSRKTIWDVAEKAGLERGSPASLSVQATLGTGPAYELRPFRGGQQQAMYRADVFVAFYMHRRMRPGKRNPGPRKAKLPDDVVYA